LEKTGKFTELDSWQLGYGYIGINAGKVPNINIRKAIMAAMNTSLAIEYYDVGTCTTINWPMSSRSWAYPWQNKETESQKDNGHDYMQWSGTAAAKQKIQSYMNAAGVSAGSSDLKITFTIAGSSITDHPTYQVFLNAQELLNDLGWQVEIKADSRALTKLATGSLEVWAAAWGSTIDPDMYQVYHKNSTATSVYAWGYREIKANTTKYATEYKIITELSEIIEDARSYMDQATRIPLYEQAMSLVLDLAVEMPVYQRKNLYAYNSSTVTGFPTSVNEYSSPLEKVWELELVK
jgi:peptide/nickel transport system substrate-binding protein